MKKKTKDFSNLENLEKSLEDQSKESFEIEEMEEKLDFGACVSNGNCGGCVPPGELPPMEQ